MSARNLTGDIAELIIYDRSITSTEVAEVRAYLATKWAIE